MSNRRFELEIYLLALNWTQPNMTKRPMTLLRSNKLLTLLLQLLQMSCSL